MWISSTSLVCWVKWAVSPERPLSCNSSLSSMGQLGGVPKDRLLLDEVLEEVGLGGSSH